MTSGIYRNRRLLETIRMLAFFKSRYCKLLAALLLAIAGWTIYTKTATPVATPLFTSGLYQDYRSLWQVPTKDSTIAAQRLFTEELRARPNLPLAKKVLSETNANPLWAEFLFALIPWNGSLNDYLFTAQSIIHQNPRYQGMGVEPFREDQFYEGNLPSQVAEIRGTTLIRMGQPMIHTNSLLRWITTPYASPEFLEFIKGQKSHIYINLMKREGEEGTLTKSLEKLGEQWPQLLVFTLDKNSDFYHQKKPLKQDFKTEFLNELIKKEGNYYFPQEFSQEELVALLLQVEDRYFSGREPETQEERKDFIELTYIALLDYLVEKFQPQSVNITCKQCIDRGPSLIALWLYSQKTFSDEEIAVQLIVPPLLFHNRASHLSRLERFVSASSRIKSIDND